MSNPVVPSDTRAPARRSGGGAWLRAGVLGAAVALALAALVRWADELDALQLLAAASWLCAVALLVRERRRARAEPARDVAPASADLRLLAAGCSAGAVLWLLAPWTQAAPPADAELSRAPHANERNWLCESSLLATPYVVARGRVLLAAERRHASLLHACALRRARGGVELAPPHPLARSGSAARARARVNAPARFDLVLVAVQPPARVLPLGALPFAAAPIETREGVRDLFALLSSDGMLAATILGEPATLRWIHTAREALRDMGATALERHFVVFAAAGAYTVLSRATPFDTDSVLAFHETRHASAPPPPTSLQRWPAWLRTRPTLQATAGAAFDTRVAAELRAGDDALAPYAFDLSAASDDRPLFYELTRRDRRDTWSDQTSYWVLAWSSTLAVVLALVVAWLATRAPAPHLLAARGRVALIIGYGGLAFGHVLALTFAQHAVSIWLLRPLDAPALSVLVLGGVAGGLFALPRSSATPARGLVLALCMLAPALLIALSRADTPSPELAVEWGQARLAWLALGSAMALAAACALGAHGWSRLAPRSVRPAALVVYVAALAPAVLLAPGLVLVSGYRMCAAGAAMALALSALAALLPFPAERTAGVATPP